MSDEKEFLSEQINEILQADERLSGYALKARVYQDGIVQIQGIVDLLEEKNRAAELLEGIPEVEQVINDITVCTDGGVDDGDVAFEVSEELRANPEIPESVGVKVYGGEVQLVGTVNSSYEVNEAMETATKARGVREVNSLLKVTPVVDDATITNLVQSGIVNQLGLIPGKVRITTEDGVVTLHGDLPPDFELEAINIASGVSGVKQVVNKFYHDGNFSGVVITTGTKK
jgi:hyperosmotically inducible protein